MRQRETSKKAFNKISHLGLVEGQEFNIYSLVKDLNADITRNEIAVALNMPTATVSARVNSLLKKCLLIEGKKREDKYTGINVNTLRVKERRA